MFRRKKKVPKKASNQPRPGPNETKKLNTQFFEFREQIKYGHGRTVSGSKGKNVSQRIIDDFLESGFKCGFLTSAQLNRRSVPGVVAQINRYADLHGYRVYARAISGLFVLERSGRKMQPRSKKIGT